MNFWENDPYGTGYGGAGSFERRGAQGADRRGGQNADARAGQCGQDGSQGVGCDFYDRLSGFTDKSEEQLMSELTSAVDRMKAEGSFDPASLERLYLTASPFLSEGQRERMRKIIDMLIK